MKFCRILHVHGQLVFEQYFYYFYFFVDIDTCISISLLKACCFVYLLDLSLNKSHGISQCNICNGRQMGVSSTDRGVSSILVVYGN